jgi:hypothetical protein
MKSVYDNLISFLLIFCILTAVFYDYSDWNKVDLKKQIVDFTKFEDSRDINKILLFFEFPLLNYWEQKKISKIELKKIYSGYWERFEYSKNEIQKIEKISDYEVVLTTKYIYRNRIASRVNRYRLSETKFKFNKSGKITSISNLSIRKIDNQYIIDNNLISDFSYKENIFLKNNLKLAFFFALLLILNLSIQAVTIKKRKKKSEKSNEFKDDIAQQKLKDEVELNRLIKIEEIEEIEEIEKLRQRDLKEAAKRDVSIKLAKEKIEKEKKRGESINWENLDAVNKRIRDLKEASDRELSIKLEKEKIEKEKKSRERIEAYKKEVARIKRNKLAKEKREEKKRLEQEKKAKDEARIKREKRVIKKREDEEREKRIKEELNLKEQQNLVKSNPEIVDQSEDTFFEDNLSQYITEIPDDDVDEAESDMGDFLADKYMPQSLKNKLKNK